MTCTFSCSKDIVIIHISLGRGSAFGETDGEIEREKERYYCNFEIPQASDIVNFACNKKKYTLPDINYGLYIFLFIMS